MRYKGVLKIQDLDRRIVFQGVHMMMGHDEVAAWKPDELRETKMVFISRELPKDVLLAGLSLCVAAASTVSAPNDRAGSICGPI